MQIRQHECQLILTYSCEDYVLNPEEMKSIIKGTEIKYLQTLKRITTRDKIRKELRRQECEIELLMKETLERAVTIPTLRILISWKSVRTGKQKQNKLDQA